MTPLHVEPLTSERLTLRGFEARDFPAYLAYYTGDRTGGVGGPLPEFKVFERFCSMIGHWQVRGFGRYAITLTGEDAAFGHAGPMQLDDTDIEMTWTLWDKAHEGKGFATEAARTIINHYFKQGWDQLVAYIEGDNTASLRVAERLGAKPDLTRAPPDFLRDGRRYLITREVAA